MMSYQKQKFYIKRIMMELQDYPLINASNHKLDLIFHLSEKVALKVLVN